MTKQELSFGDKKEVCKVVLHRLIQVRFAHLESQAQTKKCVSQMYFSSSLPQSLDCDCHGG